MTKYLVKIYNCGVLVDKQILEETDKIKLADEYIQNNQLWGEVWAETDEEELYFEKVIICLKVKADFFGINEDTVADIIKGREDETTIEEYLALDLIDFEVTQVNGYAAEDVLTLDQIRAIEKSIAEQIELDYMNDESGIKLVIQEYERSKRRGIPKEIAEQFSKEIVDKVKDVVRKIGVRYADLSDIQLQLALELASRRMSFEGCLYLPKLTEKHRATILAAANQGYDIMSMIETEHAQYSALNEINLVSEALDRNHLEILEAFDKLDSHSRWYLLELLRSDLYHPIFLDERVSQNNLRIRDIQEFLSAGASIEKFQELLETSSSSEELKALMQVEELLQTDSVLGKKLIDHLKKTVGILALADNTSKYELILELMRNDRIDADEFLKLSDRLTYQQILDIAYAYRDDHDLFEYIKYNRIDNEIIFKAAEILIEENALKPLELFRDSTDYDWVLKEDRLSQTAMRNPYEEIAFAFDSSLSSAESKTIIDSVSRAYYDNGAHLAKVKEIFDNRANLDTNFIEAIEALSQK
mgnify:CR=1 FL=1